MVDYKNDAILTAVNAYFKCLIFSLLYFIYNPTPPTISASTDGSNGKCTREDKHRFKTFIQYAQATFRSVLGLGVGLLVPGAVAARSYRTLR